MRTLHTSFQLWSWNKLRIWKKISDSLKNNLSFWSLCYYLVANSGFLVAGQASHVGIQAFALTFKPPAPLQGLHSKLWIRRSLFRKTRCKFFKKINKFKINRNECTWNTKHLPRAARWESRCLGGEHQGSSKFMLPALTCSEPPRGGGGGTSLLHQDSMHIENAHSEEQGNMSSWTIEELPFCESTLEKHI